MHTVPMGVIESEFERRRREFPHETADATFKAVCRKLGIASLRVITSLRRTFVDERSILLVGRWQARKSTAKPTTNREGWLDKWEREHDQ